MKNKIINENYYYYSFSDIIKDFLRIALFNVSTPFGLLWNLYLAKNKMDRITAILNNCETPEEIKYWQEKLDNASRVQVKRYKEIQDSQKKLENIRKFKDLSNEEKDKIKNKTLEKINDKKDIILNNMEKIKKIKDGK